MSDISKKLKIAFLVERFPKLSETFILNQLTYLVKAGHEVDIFPAGRSGEKMVHDEINRLRLLTRTYYPPDSAPKQDRGMAQIHPNGKCNTDCSDIGKIS
jgi:hypothetical protein